MEIPNSYSIGVLGCGTMGSAVLNAVLTGLSGPGPSAAVPGVPVPGAFYASVNSSKSAEGLADRFGNRVTVAIGDNSAVVREADLIIVGYKPFVSQQVLREIPGELFAGKTVVSLMAGVTIKQISEWTGGESVVARAMTNTPSQIGAGMTVVSIPDSAPQSAKDAIRWIFNCTGRCLFLDEKYMDVATALCGSGPAFCFLMMEAMSDGAVRMGMPYPIAQECAAQVMHGASQMVLQGNHPAVLRNAVCTPGGTTIGGLMVLEDKAVRSSIARAVEEAATIAKGLGK